LPRSRRAERLRHDPLQTLEPAPAGTRWWGWLSDVVSYSASGPQNVAVTFPVALPRPADGGPQPGPFAWRAVVGGRAVDQPSGLLGTRPVNCGPTAHELYLGFNEQGGAGSTISCVSSPSQATVRTDLSASFTDFGLTGTSVRASAGSSVTATFLAKRSGDPDPATTFALAVSGGPPGTAVTLDRASVSLGGDAVAPVLATVSIPHGAASGSYPLTLTATAPGKPTRTATSTVTVGPLPGPPATPRIESAALTRTRFRVARQATALAADARDGASAPAAVAARAKRRTTPAGTQLRVRLSEAATLSLTVQRVRAGRRSGRTCSLRAQRGRRCSVTTTAGKLTRRLPSGASTIPFSGRIGRRALPVGRYRLVLEATDAASNRSTPRTLSFAIVAR
jgi:hypothetical protein